MPRSCVFYVMTIDAGARPIKVHPTGSAVSEGEVPVMLFEELYERYLPHVFRYVLVLTRDRDEADDVTSETFARALRAWRSGSEPAGSTLPWLLTIARNVATDSWRRARRILGRPPEASGPSDAARVEGIMWLQSVSAILPGRQREVIALRYYRELSDSEIGAVMGLSQSGVRSLVARAIETLRKHPEVWQ